jgi:hypothetical protein
MEDKLLTEDYLQKILNKAINKSITDLIQHFENTVVKDFKDSDSIREKLSIVTDFAESVDYDYSNDF